MCAVRGCFNFSKCVNLFDNLNVFTCSVNKSFKRDAHVADYGEKNIYARNEIQLKKYPPGRPGQLVHSWGPMNAPFNNERIDKKLFTPGPLGVSKTTKEAMLRDLGSRDKEFMETIKIIRHRLLDLAGVSSNHFTSIFLQGSGTYAVDAVLQTITPQSNGKLLIIANGAYGMRMQTMCQRASLNYDFLQFSETDKVPVEDLEKHLQKENYYTGVAVVHCETTTGLVNDLTPIGKLVKKYCPKAVFVVDAMSSFGAIPVDFEQAQIDYLVTSANKCLEGVPGFAIVIANVEHLLSCKGNCRSLSLDIVDQHVSLEKTGQFRFTPPTHTLLALAQALKELDSEGGIQGRACRYRTNCDILKEGMKKFGFCEVLPDNVDGYIITTYYLPKNPKFDFSDFYKRLNELDQVIYPGKVTEIDTFRIANIGHLFPDDIIQLLRYIEKVCLEMGLTLPLKRSF